MWIANPKYDPNLVSHRSPAVMLVCLTTPIESSVVHLHTGCNKQTEIFAALLAIVDKSHTHTDLSVQHYQQLCYKVPSRGR